MITTNLEVRLDSIRRHAQISVPRSSAWTINLAILSTAGVSANLTGKTVAFTLAEHPQSAFPGTEYSVAGTSTGIVSKSFTAEQISASPSEWYRLTIDVVDALGERTALLGESCLVRIAPTLSLPTPPVAPVIEPPPPVVNTIEVTGALDLSGTSTQLPAGAPVRVPLNYLTGWRVTIPQLNTSELAAGWTAKVWLSRTAGSVKLGSVPLAAVPGSPGVFAGNMSRSLANSIGSVAYQYEIGLYDPQGNQPYTAVLPTDVYVLATGIPLDSPPTVAIDSPSADSTVLPSAVTVQFSYTGAVAFTALVDGIADESIEVTSANGVGSYSVSVASVGAIALGVRATSELGTPISASRNVTCALPTVTIVSPTEGASFDVQTVTALVGCSPAMPDGTVVRLVSGATTLATGALTSGGATE